MTCKIKAIKVWKENLDLIRPYTIATKTISAVENVFVQILLENGITGWGSCNPDAEVAGENPEEAYQTLQQFDKDKLIGSDIRSYQGILSYFEQAYPKKPGTLAALDIALHDAFTQHLGIPLVSYLGVKKRKLPTSVTIGIMDTTATLAQAQEFYTEGFRVLKVKLGSSPEEDLERLIKLREAFGEKVILRVDFNQAYDAASIMDFEKQAVRLDIELIEQPSPPGQEDQWRSLSWRTAKKIAADESLLGLQSAHQLLYPTPACGIFNIKLMKCGGIKEALRIADIARTHGIALMWGCNDESRISIAAALHAAFSCVNTRYIDLDGSFDLARDVVKGGFIVTDGIMRLTGKPGLGMSDV